MGQTAKVSGRATTTYTDERGTHIRYHATEVVSFDAKRVTLRTGGYRTLTTRTRMNQASNQYDLGYHVFQKDFAWFVNHAGKVIPFLGTQLVLKR
jgi:hypothetical protein